jgi:hypothetical protein
MVARMFHSTWPVAHAPMDRKNWQFQIELRVLPPTATAAPMGLGMHTRPLAKSRSMLHGALRVCRLRGLNPLPAAELCFSDCPPSVA